MRLAFFGDVVGRAGRQAVTKHLPRLRSDLKLDAVVINAENAAGGFGITRATADESFMKLAQMCLPLAIIVLIIRRALP